MHVGQALIPHRLWHPEAEGTVLALHCSLAHAGAWSGLAALLPERRVLAVDQAGHGRQPAWDGQSDLFGQTLSEALALAPPRFDLVGHSFGGVVALRLALDHPDRVQSLTLIEPPLFAAARAAGDLRFATYHARHRAFEALVHQGRPREALAAFHGDWGNGVALEALPDRVVGYMQDRIHLIAGQAAVLQDDRAGILAPGGLERLAMPILLIEGLASPPIAGAILTALAARLPQARREGIAGAGHMVPITHPAEVAQVLRPHLGLKAPG